MSFYKNFTIFDFQLENLSLRQFERLFAYDVIVLHLTQQTEVLLKTTSKASLTVPVRHRLYDGLSFLKAHHPARHSAFALRRCRYSFYRL